MRIVFLSHTAMGGAFVVGSHHLAKALSRAGHDVTHLSAPVSLPHLALALKDTFVRTRILRWLRGGEDFEGVRDLVPFTPLPWNLARLSPSLMTGYSRLMLPAPLRSLRSLGLRTADYLVIDEPRFAGVAVKNCAATIIYRATDLYSALRRDPRIIDAELRLCDRASAVVATSEPVASHLEQLSGRSVRVIANGVEFDHFARRTIPPAAPIPWLPGRREERAVYVGSFDSRFGRHAFRSAVTTLPDRYFILIGPGSRRVAADFPRPNVFSLGAVAYASLPGILHQCAVGLLPLSEDASNSGRSPMKLYEYVAAGLCVAATSTHELRRRRLPTLILAESDSQFGATVRQAFERAGNESLLEQAQTSARRESWECKAQDLMSAMQASRALRGDEPGQCVPQRLGKASPVAGRQGP